MAFTRGWDDAAPPGTRNANEIDNAIRELRVDINERVASKLFTTPIPNTTVEADLVVRPEVLGNATKKLLIHGVAFQIESTDDGNYGDDGLSGLGVHEPFQAPLLLPPGVTITRIRWLVSLSGAAQTVTGTIKSMAFGAGHAAATLDTRNTSVNGADQILDSGAISLALDDTHCYFLVIDSGGGLTAVFTIHGVEITYTNPDCRNTI